MPNIDWEARKKEIEEQSSAIWRDVVDFVGKEKIRIRTSEAPVACSFTRSQEIPAPELVWTKQRFAASCFPKWKLYMNPFWQLEETDLPKNWQEMNVYQLHVYAVALLRDNRLTAKEQALIKQVQNPLQSEYHKYHEIMPGQHTALFVHLVKQKQWEAARKAIIAHELSHISGSGLALLSQYNAFQSRLFEKEADFIACSLPDIEIKAGLMAFMKISSELSPNEADRRVVDIASQDSKETHPTLMTRYNYISRF